MIDAAMRKASVQPVDERPFRQQVTPARGALCAAAEAEQEKRRRPGKVNRHKAGIEDQELDISPRHGRNSIVCDADDTPGERDPGEIPGQAASVAPHELRRLVFLAVTHDATTSAKAP